jgi:hypothetical protein
MKALKIIEEDVILKFFIRFHNFRNRYLQGSKLASHRLVSLVYQPV